MFYFIKYENLIFRMNECKNFILTVDLNNGIKIDLINFSSNTLYIYSN